MIKRLALIALLLAVIAASYVIWMKNSPESTASVDKTSLPINGMVGGTVQNAAEKAAGADGTQTTPSPDAASAQPAAEVAKPMPGSVPPAETDDLPRDAELSGEPAAATPPVEAPKAPEPAALPPSEGR